MPDPVVIIGGGLSGLTCAKEFHAKGVDFILLEASDAVGGRVRTDEVDGFLLDRGFQVLLTAYPEAQRQLNYAALNLQPFEPGSLIRTRDGFQQLSDPWRRPQHALQSAFCSIGGFTDKLKIGSLRWSAGRGTLDGAFERPDRTTEQELQRLGFSESMTEKFLRPFLGGVFLDHELQTSSRMLYFVFRMFSQGDTTLPAAGMGAIPAQLADGLPEETIRIDTAVDALEMHRVVLRSGEAIPYSNVVIATEQPAAARLLPELATQRTPRSVYCVYFSAPERPVEERMLVLNGTQTGVVNNLCVPSAVASGYAPAGRSLISTTVLNSTSDAEDLPQQITEELRDWFGNVVDSWQHLRTYHIPYALPNQTSPAFEPTVFPAEIRKNVFVCGDYRANGSINGAMESGRRAAEETLNQM